MALEEAYTAAGKEPEPRPLTPIISRSSKFLRVMAHNPNLLRSKYKRVHALDAGESLLVGHSLDILRGIVR